MPLAPQVTERRDQAALIALFPNLLCDHLVRSEDISLNGYMSSNCKIRKQLPMNKHSSSKCLLRRMLLLAAATSCGQWPKHLALLAMHEHEEV